MYVRALRVRECSHLLHEIIPATSVQYRGECHCLCVRTAYVVTVHVIVATCRVYYVDTLYMHRSDHPSQLVTRACYVCWE